MKKLTTFKKGTEAYLWGRRCQIVGVVGARTVRISFLDDGQSVQTDIDNLWEDIPADEEAAPSIDILHPRSLQKANERLVIIEPLLGLKDGVAAPTKAKDLYAEVSSRHGVSVATLYSWVAKYTRRRLLSDLAPNNRTRHKRKLDPRAEEILQDELKVFLSGKRRTLQKIHKKVLAQCEALGISAPGMNTVWRRVKELPPRAIVTAKLGPKAAHDMYEQIRGHYPGADYPLAYVQIDHTKLDITIVGSRDRRPIGRVWLTVAIDVFSRMIVGIYISLEAPGEFSTFMCIRRAVLPKEDYLLSLGVTGEWPVWGFMRHLHADNGADFRTEAFKENLRQYGCWPMWRKLRTPHYGGHVERLIGTINRVLHELPGTTFSNPQERREYDSEGNAVFTIDELEQLLVHWIVNIYHKSYHEGIGCTPLEKWEAGILGTDGSPGVGLQDRVENPERVALDLMPFDMRTVQRDGISWDRITYRSEALVPWVRAKENGRGRLFKVRRDPRDVSCVWFLDPVSGEYHRIQEETRQMRPISLWEHMAAKEYSEERNGRRVQSTREAVAAHNEFDHMTEVAEEKTKATKTVRRKQERRRRHQATLAQECYASEASVSKPEVSKPSRPRLVVDNVQSNVRPPSEKNDDQDFNLTAEDLLPKAEEI